MTKVIRLEAGRYSVSDGRFIIKNGSNWFVLNHDGNHDFGPLPTFAAAKEYVTTGSVTPKPIHNPTSYSKKQSKKQFNAYIASEAKRGNKGPLIIYIILMIVMFIFTIVIQANK